MTDEQTEALKRFNDEQAKIVAEYVKKSVIEELKKIKNEINNGYPTSVEDILWIIDNEISEWKGENKWVI